MGKKISTGILYLILYVILPCGADEQCEENKAKFVFYTFDTTCQDNEISSDFYSDGRYFFKKIKCSEAKFEELLKELKKDIVEIKEKNRKYVDNRVQKEDRGIGYNNRVLIIKKEQLGSVFKILNNYLGSQECPVIATYDENNRIKGFTDLYEFCFSLNNTVSEGEKVDPHNKKGDEAIKEIFDVDLEYYNYIIKWMGGENNDINLEKIAEIRKNIFSTIDKNFDDDDRNDFIKKKDFKILEDGKCIRVLSLKDIYQTYKDVEKSLIVGDKRFYDYHLRRYRVLRKILLQAKVITCLLRRCMNKEKKKNTIDVDFIKKNILELEYSGEDITHEDLEKLKDKFLENCFDFFFNMSSLNIGGEGNAMEKAVNTCTTPYDCAATSRSILDLTYLLNNPTGKTLLNCGSVVSTEIAQIKDLIDQVSKGGQFEESESALFSIVKNLACDNKELFNALTEEIKSHFNCVLFTYLGVLFAYVKKISEGEDYSYEFRKANVVSESIIAIANILGEKLKDENKRPNILFDLLTIFTEFVSKVNISGCEDILMETSMIIEVLMEYLIYTKNLNKYTADQEENRQKEAKKNHLSNKLESFYVMSKDDYEYFTGNANSNEKEYPPMINKIEGKMEEKNGDEPDNNANIRIIFMGDMRAGKTMFVRNLFGEEHRDKFKVGSGDYSTTHKISHFNQTYDNFIVDFVDTPGFENTNPESDMGYSYLDKNFKNLFVEKKNNTIVLDMVIFKEGKFKCLSKTHRTIVKRILHNNIDIIFLLPFTASKKKEKQMKEQFLASLFFSLYIDSKKKYNHIKLEKKYNFFKTKVKAIPINQFYDKLTESKFGLKEVKNAVIEIVKEKLKNSVNINNFQEEFLKNSEEELCEDDKDLDNIRNDNMKPIHNEKKRERLDKKIISLKEAIQKILTNFNGLHLRGNNNIKKNVIINDNLYKEDNKNSVVIDNNNERSLLYLVYRFYSGYIFLLESFKVSPKPIVKEVFKTNLYRITEFIKSPDFFNYLCLKNEDSGYNIFLFEEEIEILNKKEYIKDIIKKQKELAKFCLLAEHDNFLMDNDFVNSINNMCIDDLNKYKKKEGNAGYAQEMWDNIKSEIYRYLNFNNKEDEEQGDVFPQYYKDFLICYDNLQRKYVLNRANLSLLGFNLKRDEGLYEKIPDSLKRHMYQLNNRLKNIKKIEELENPKEADGSLLYKRYHHIGKEIRSAEREQIKSFLKEKKGKEEPIQIFANFDFTSLKSWMNTVKKVSTVVANHGADKKEEERNEKNKIKKYEQVEKIETYPMEIIIKKEKENVENKEE